MYRCGIDIENERRELNSKSACTRDYEDEDFHNTPTTSSRPNDRDEVFRKLDIALAKLDINIPGVNHG